MNRDELFKRTRQVLNPQLTAKQAVLVVGAGSGGSRVAEEIVRFGTGRVMLVDRPNETLEEHNIIRHALGYRDMGRSKVAALRDRLLDIHPQCDVRTHELDVTRDEAALAELVSRATLVLLCTDNERSKHALNAAAVRAAVPMVFAGVFDGGCGGEVGRVLPGQACYACIAAYLQRSPIASQADESVETFDYANPASMQQSTAALNIDIAQIALLQARVALLTMLDDPAGEMDGNYLLFGNRAVAGLFPRMLTSEIWRIPRAPACMVCSQGDSGNVDAAAEQLLAAAEVMA
jgi:molybdopterin/thiamine biosynthesis adenylyltransferase